MQKEIKPKRVIDASIHNSAGLLEDKRDLLCFVPQEDNIAGLEGKKDSKENQDRRGDRCRDHPPYLRLDPATANPLDRSNIDHLGSGSIDTHLDNHRHHAKEQRQDHPAEQKSSLERLVHHCNRVEDAVDPVVLDC